MCNMLLVGAVILLSLFIGVIFPFIAIKCFEAGLNITTGEKITVTPNLKPVFKRKPKIDPEVEKETLKYKKLLNEIDNYNGGVK